MKQIAIAIDQLLNALLRLLGVESWADESLSSHAYRMDRDDKPWGMILRPIIDTIFFWQYRHCFHAYLSEKNRMQLPPEFRS